MKKYLLVAFLVLPLYLHIGYGEDLVTKIGIIPPSSGCDPTGGNGLVFGESWNEVEPSNDLDKQYSIEIKTKQFNKDKEILNEIIDRHQKEEINATISNYQNDQYLLKQAKWIVDIPIDQLEPLHRELSKTFPDVRFNRETYRILKKQKPPIDTIITLREVPFQLVNE